MKEKRIVIGILAHVDAGKTTLSESILYLSGSIRKPGRVDHRNAFLDNNEMERNRGITIFSKQARFRLGDTVITLLDTPGHVDFSAEMERVLAVLDYAVLVISGAAGVQGHTLTLWKLLQRYRVPVLLFVNKMDQPETDRALRFMEMKERLEGNLVDFGDMQEKPAFWEEIALSDEHIMEKYLETGQILKTDIAGLIAARKLFPCYFGSALKNIGVEDFLAGLSEYAIMPDYPDEFAARVFKISRDPKGTRLTHLKITGGSLKVRDFLNGEEKVNQIRLYSGEKYDTPGVVFPGEICTVTGPEQTFAGEGLGAAGRGIPPVLEPVLTYQMLCPPSCDKYKLFLQLKQLEEEEPQLNIVWDQHSSEIHAQVMGAVEMEILQTMMEERYGIHIEFGPGSIVYKETIAGPVIGVGHFEPLRHYSEVHLLLEPLERGGGMVFETNLSEDILSGNFQRLVLTHLKEKKHIGVLTGAEITDLKITLVAGRAHLKHTEGGDFREATYRAVRQGLKKAESILLEPVYEFLLEVPADSLGRALSDIRGMQGKSEPPVMEGEVALIKGRAAVAAMADYQITVNAYSRGMGKLTCVPGGYEPCFNPEEVVFGIGYDSEKDPENPTGSVFCAHGAGFTVSWDQVEDYMHLESGIDLPENPENREKPADRLVFPKEAAHQPKGRSKDYYHNEKELEQIFTRTYGPIKRECSPLKKTVPASAYPGKITKRPARQEPRKDKYLLVDGYNIIFAWDELKELAKDNLDGARYRLMDILCNYQGYIKDTVILVFDAYKVKGNPGDVQKYNNIYVVYTKEAESADQYIERAVHQIVPKSDVCVATSDAMEQMIIWGAGALRLSAQGLKEEITAAAAEWQQEFMQPDSKAKVYPFRDKL